MKISSQKSKILSLGQIPCKVRKPIDLDHRRKRTKQWWTVQYALFCFLCSSPLLFHSIPLHSDSRSWSLHPFLPLLKFSESGWDSKVPVVSPVTFARHRWHTLTAQSTRTPPSCVSAHDSSPPRHRSVPALHITQYEYYFIDWWLDWWLLDWLATDYRRIIAWLLTDYGLIARSRLNYENCGTGIVPDVPGGNRFRCTAERRSWWDYCQLVLFGW